MVFTDEVLNLQKLLADSSRLLGFGQSHDLTVHRYSSVLGVYSAFQRDQRYERPKNLETETGYRAALPIVLP